MSDLDSKLKKNRILSFTASLLKRFGRFCFTHAAGISVGLAAALSAGVLLLVPLKYYYRDHLFLNTWVDSRYYAGYTRQRAIDDLNIHFPEAKIKIILEEGETEINISEYVSSFDYTDPVEELFSAQEEKSFIRSFGPKNYHIAPKMEFSEKLDQLWEKLSGDNVKHGFDYYYSGYKGFFISNDSLGHVFDSGKAYAALREAMRRLDESVDLRAGEFFYDKEPTEDELKLMEAFDKVNAYQTASIYYDMGDEKIKLTPRQLCSLLVIEDGYPLVNDKDCFVIDESKIPRVAEELFEPYNTIDKDREFKTVSGRYISTSSSEYGTEINMRAEENYLNYAVRRVVAGEKEIGSRVPVYNITANNRGLNDIGYDYIEVDTGNQKLYLIVDGECALEADIVTGRDGLETPDGLFTVSSMQKDRFLIKYNYNVFVNFQIELSNGYSITNAIWRDGFGGDIYHENGSAGNIEMSYGTAQELYNACSEGMPVIVYGEAEIITDQ
ncbi:MAG: L,D-transpeptidase [Lachnospiraceae bacterium]|nr:L,D-transpeptidase [Lachnospiraceae bacterium]